VLHEGFIIDHMPNLHRAHSLWVATLSITGGVLLFPAAARASVVFQDIINNGDTAFNQELAINNSGLIAGYFGDGSVVPNNGYTVGSPYTSFNAENYPSMFEAQTQVTGINNGGDTVGFWVDTSGANHGFTDFGNSFMTWDAPSPNPAVPMFTQFLGVNDSREVAGFNTDANNDSHASATAQDPKVSCYRACIDPVPPDYRGLRPAPRGRSASRATACRKRPPRTPIASREPKSSAASMEALPSRSQ
jgi:hypothetical protein